MKLKDLSAHPGNPRTITDVELFMLKKALKEFGDLGCIVFNRKTKRLVGGHQRIKVLPETSEVFYEKKYSEPTRTGTVAEGIITIDGENFKYREVEWGEEKEKAANIAANKHGGHFDMPKLADMLIELDSINLDMDLVGFTKDELAGIMAPVDFEPGTEEDQGQLDEKKPVQCPNCGEQFVPKS